MIYRKGVENIDWGGRGGDWECTTAVDVGRWQEVHSCVGDFGKAWVLLEVVGSQGIRVQNAQLGYIVHKSLNRQWFESFCSSQEDWCRHKGVSFAASVWILLLSGTTVTEG